MSKRSACTQDEEDRNRAIIKYEEYKHFVENQSMGEGSSGAYVSDKRQGSCLEGISRKKLKRIHDNFDEYTNFVEHRSQLMEIGSSKPVQPSENVSDGSDTNSDDEVVVESKSALSKKLAHFVCASGMKNKKVNSLLNILSDDGISGIPRSYEKLMGTPTEKVIVREFEGGNVWHYGITKALQCRENELKDLEEINLDIGVDGARIFNSSALKLWPTMGAVTNKIRMKPFLIGCYEGKKDPSDCGFMDEFCDELEYVQKNGVCFSYGIRNVKMRLICADAPARATICSVKGHSSHDGCPLCIMKYRIWDQKVVFGSEIGPTLRTDASFSARRDLDHHRIKFRNEHSRLERLKIGMVSQVVIDPMHAIDLGVTGDKLEFLKKNNQNVPEISQRMLDFLEYIPDEFARDCRSLEYLKFFKATELRQFLRYGCVTFLKDLVDEHIYYMWLLLHCAVRLMSEGSASLEQAEILLKEFVELYPNVYGENSVTYNVHMLLHIPYYVKLYGPLDSFSAYKFENFIQYLKKLVGRASNPLQQIFNRIEERKSNFAEPDEIIAFDTCNLQIDEKNSFFAIKSEGKIFPVKVVDLTTENGVQSINVFRCLGLKSLFTHPMDSAQLGEFSYEHLSATEEVFPLSAIHWKYCRMPLRNEFALIPILHTSFHKFQN